jgi:hypothetical protein
MQAVTPRNRVWKLANRNKPAEGYLEALFARVKQMEDIDDNKYWSKRWSKNHVFFVCHIVL